MYILLWFIFILISYKDTNWIKNDLIGETQLIQKYQRGKETYSIELWSYAKIKK